MSDTQLTEIEAPVLGKRKRQENYVLQLSGGSESELEGASDSSPSPVASSSKTQLNSVPTIVNGKLLFDVKKKYACTFEGCDKSYTKPCRLEEHERIHTGERPFVCSVCSKSYFRESHLQAHSRSHMPDSARNFVCTRDGCGKKFWTAQHLRRHEAIHEGEKPFKCLEHGCEFACSKHYQLRAHTAQAHCPPGTKPFRCDHVGCTMSFISAQKLKAHSKTHDERRYVCSHPTCLSNEESVCFPTWTALQAHHRSMHPATCPYLSCNGKTFSQQKGLRAHLKIHEQEEVEKSLIARVRDEEGDADDEDEDRPMKRRRGGEVGRDWKCDVEGCGKDFKSKKALNTHHEVTHLQRRNWTCEVEGCGVPFGYKHLLQRHVARAHPTTDETNTTQMAIASASIPTAGLSAIEVLTGVAYVERTQTLLSNNRKVHQCPFRSFVSNAEDGVGCSFVFSRAYDLKRHLKSAHDIEVSREAADEWVRGAVRAHVQH